MKKIFLASIMALSVVGGAIITSNSIKAAQIEMTSEGVHENVPVYSFSSHASGRSTATIVTDAYGTPVKAIKNGEWNVRSSDRDGYSYMFSTRYVTYYFNL